MKKLLFTACVLGILYACSDSPEKNIQFEVIENDKPQKLDALYSELFKKEKFCTIFFLYFLIEKPIILNPVVLKSYTGIAG
jgi:hypothetical protein